MHALTWLATTGITLWFILKRNTQLHRQWMTRSFAVALVFIEVRAIEGMAGWDTPPNPAIDEAVVWFCNTLSILMADIVLQWKDFAPRGRAANVAFGGHPASGS